MQIVYHVGVHCTDGGRLHKSLMRDVEALSAAGVAIPGPGRYRRLLRETIQALGGGDPAPDTREVLLDAILDGTDCSRMIMSNAVFFCTPQRVLENGRLYDMAEAKLSALGRLFPADEIEIFLGIRNPATFVPAVFETAPERSFRRFVAGTDPLSLRWSDLVARLRTALPRARLVVWCNEDTPLLWPSLLAELAGTGSRIELSGRNDLLETIMSPEGMRRYLAYLRTHPPQTDSQLRRVIAAFLDKYALEDEIEEELDLPGWDGAMIAALTRAYEEDIPRLAAVPGVTFLAP